MSDDTIIDGEATEETDGHDPPSALPALREETAVVARGEISVQELLEQSEKIAQAMKGAMTENIHYGRIPGVKKPSLLKPGAEKLLVLFRFSPHYASEKIWHDDGHLTVSTVCELRHIPTGLVVATGEGLCSTKESRYAWRRGERLCPECSEPQVRKGKPRDGRPGNWYCWKKEGGCGSTWDLDSEQGRIFDAMETGRIQNPDIADSYNCVTPETRILTRDLRWVPAGELSTGDAIIGVAEEYDDSAGGRYDRPYAEGVVTVGPLFEDDLYEVTTEDGRTVRCNGEHRWLVNESGVGGTEWVRTEAIYENMKDRPSGRPRVWRIASICSPWSDAVTKDAGYLAGLLDADGTLGVANHSRRSGYHSVAVQFAQQEGPLLNHFVAQAAGLGFQFALTPHRGGVGTKAVFQATLRGGLFAQMRLLGTLRPPRLLQRWAGLVDLSRRRMESKRCRIVRVERVGRGTLVALGTSCRTYIAEGLVCHNTVVKMAGKRALVAAVLNGTAASDVFTQDVEDAPSAGGGGYDGYDDGPQERVQQRPFDPSKDLLPSAPTSRPALREVATHIDPGDKAGLRKMLGAAVVSLYGKALGDLRDDDLVGASRRSANAVTYLRDTVLGGSDFPPPTVEQIQEAIAFAFDGIRPDPPEAEPQEEQKDGEGDAALTPSEERPRGAYDEPDAMPEIDETIEFPDVD